MGGAIAEPETLKIILQGGMFGLWVIFIIWLLFYGAPMLRDSLKNLAEGHDAAVTHLAEAHKEAVKTLAADCREERQELLELFAQKLKEQKP